MFGTVSEWLQYYNRIYYTLFWILNGFFQGTTWPILVAIMGNWYGLTRYGLFISVYSILYFALLCFLFFFFYFNYYIYSDEMTSLCFTNQVLLFLKNKFQLVWNIAICLVLHVCEVNQVPMDLLIKFHYIHIPSFLTKS